MALSSCCCGCSLAEGTKGVGIYNLIRVFFLLCGFLVILAAKEFGQRIPAALDYNVYQISICLGITLLVLIFSILMIMGVLQERSSYLLPFLILDGMIIFGLVVNMVLLLFGSEWEVMNQEPIVLMINIFLSVFFCALEIYLFVVVLAYRKQLADQEEVASLPQLNLEPTKTSTSYIYDALTEDSSLQSPVSPPPYPGL